MFLIENKSFMLFKMKLISANIRFDNPNDLKKNWAGRRLLMAKCLNNFSPDILGTQEGRMDQLKDLEGLLVGLKMESRNRNWILERMYPTIFYNPKTVSVIDSGDIWLSKTPTLDGSIDFNSTFPRLFTWIKGKISGSKFFLVNVHLDHGTSQTRAFQAQVLVEETRRLNKEELPIIIVGDFNEGPSLEVRSIISKGFPKIYDPWERLGLKEEGSHQKKGAQRIDWILCDRSFSCESITLDKTHKGYLYPSDHYPVLAVISAPASVR
jgi:endonuclease/exonuclease/phosphatase family metal-dependent hydrolase